MIFLFWSDLIIICLKLRLCCGCVGSDLAGSDLAGSDLGCLVFGFFCTACLGDCDLIIKWFGEGSINNGFGGGGIGPEDFSTAIITVSKGIIEAASFFADPKNTGVWKGGPTKEWAEGVGTAIGAFSPVYGMLMNNGIAKIVGGGGVGPVL